MWTRNDVFSFQIFLDPSLGDNMLYFLVPEQHMIWPCCQRYKNNSTHWHLGNLSEIFMYVVFNQSLVIDG